MTWHARERKKRKEKAQKQTLNEVVLNELDSQSRLADTTTTDNDLERDEEKGEKKKRMNV